MEVVTPEKSATPEQKPLTVKFATLGKGATEAEPITKEFENKETTLADEVNFELDEKPIVDPKETPAQKVEREKKETPAAQPKKDYGKYKPYAKGYIEKEELDSDDDIEAIIKGRDAKISKLETLAQGRSKLNEDKDYQGWNNWLKAGDEELVREGLVYDYMSSDGLSREAALEKANAKIKAKGEKDSDWVEENARAARKQLRGMITQKEGEVLQQLETAQKEIQFTKPSAEFEGSAKKELLKQTEFLGMKLPSDEKERTKRLNGAYIAPVEMQDLLKDPATYAEVSLFLKYKKQWAANIKNRTNGKADVIGRFPKDPPRGAQFNSTKGADGDAKKGFNGDSFLGRNAS